MADAPAVVPFQIERSTIGVRLGLRAVLRWTVELLPLAVTVALLWAKLVHLSAFVLSAWWSNEPSIGKWMRPTLDLSEMVRANPAIAVGTLACLLVLLGPVLLAPRGSRFAILLVVNIALTILGLTDVLHVRFYGDVFTESSFTTPRMMRDILPSIVDLAKLTNPVYVIDLPLVLLAIPVYLFAFRGMRRSDLAERSRMAFVVVVVGLALGLPTLGPARQDEALFSPASPRIEAAAVTGLLPYHVLETIAPRPGGVERARGQLERVRSYLAAQRQQRGAPSPLFGAARGSNVLLVSLESLQAFPIGLEIDGQTVAPNLTRFARESLYFTNYYEQTYLGTTSDAQFSVLTALHPQPVGFVAMDYADRDYRALPQILTEHGYATFAAVAAPGDFWNADKLHTTYGLQHSYFESDYTLTEMLGPWLSDRAFFEQTAPILEGQAAPYFGELLTSSNHHPFDLPHHYQLLRLGHLEGTLLGTYLQSVHLFDRSFGEFIERLRASGVLDRTLVVMYGDHQAFLGDPPELGDLLGRPDWTEYDRFSVRKRVPLIVRLPHGAHAGDRPVVGGHLDVAPTILGLLGIEDDGVMLGRDLTREGPSLVVFRDGSFADDTHFYVQRFGAASPAACYVAASGQPVDCTTLDENRKRARARLEVSDAIVQGNLTPGLLGRP